MGILFIEHLGGKRIIQCQHCATPLSNKDEIISTRFTGSTGRAFLFNRDRVMLTGRHLVRDVHCIKCGIKLGWVYEQANDDGQRYKEGKVILERLLFTETEGFKDPLGADKKPEGHSEQA